MSGKACDECGLHRLDASTPCPRCAVWWKENTVAQQFDDSGIYDTYVAMHCTCGTPTTAYCHQQWPHEGLVLCNEPWCGKENCGHRHQPGTMGYPKWKGATSYVGDSPDGPGFWEWLKSTCRHFFWSAPRKAQHAWDEIKSNFPPPSPYPFTQLAVGSRKFECRGEKMVEVEEWTR